jgi:hypothetical protein
LAKTVPDRPTIAIPATTLGLMSDVWAAGMAYAQA